MLRMVPLPRFAEEEQFKVPPPQRGGGGKRSAPEGAVTRDQTRSDTLRCQTALCSAPAPRAAQPASRRRHRQIFQPPPSPSGPFGTGRITPDAMSEYINHRHSTGSKIFFGSGKL